MMTNSIIVVLKLFVLAAILSFSFLNFNSPKTYLYPTNYNIASNNISLLSNNSNKDTYFDTISLILTKEVDLVNWAILSTHFKLSGDFSSVYEIQTIIAFLTIN